MKAILKYKLPKEKEEFNRVSKADDLCSVLYEFKEWLRKELEDKEDDHPLMEAHKVLWELMEDNMINFDELWT